MRITLKGVETVLLDTNLGLFPVGFSPDGATFYYVQLSPAAPTWAGWRPPAGLPRSSPT